MSRLFVAASSLALALSGCLNNTPPPLAPEKLDDNIRWFWVNNATVDDATLLDGAAKLGAAGDAASRTEALKGQMRGRLAAADLAPVGLDLTNDPSTARGLFIVNTYECTLKKLEGILIALDQKDQYTGVYDSYTRTYTSDAQAFTSGAADTLTWDVEVKASLPINDAYTSQLSGGIRRVKGAADGPTKGDLLITRTWLKAPATFNEGSSSYFRQDYQVEMYWEETPGKIFHAYGMWREIKVGGFNLSIEDNGFMNIVLDNLVAWDTTTAELCKKL